MGSPDTVYALLVKLELVTPRQLERAKAAAGGGLDEVLDALARQRAWWQPDVQQRTPALSSFQLQQIRRSGQDSLSRLKRALRIERYLVLRKLGRGGMGIVYLGWDLQEKHLVAIKRVKVESNEVRKRFRREKRVLAQLDHDRIARLYRTVKDGSAEALIMEYLDGRSLVDETKARHPIPWREVASWAADLMDALAHAHERKVLHRDIKPNNVLFHSEKDRQRPKLLDLGLAKSFDSQGAGKTDATRVGQVVGSWQYMAPEQWSGAEKATPGSDLYGLGATLYFALTGSPPFPGTDLAFLCRAHTTLPPPSARAVRADVPEDFDRILRTMLAKTAGERGTALQLRALFRRLAERPDEPAPIRPAPAALISRSVPIRAPVAPSTASVRAVKPDEEGTFLGSIAGLIGATWRAITSRQGKSTVFGTPREQMARHWRRLRRRTTEGLASCGVVFYLALAAVAGLLGYAIYRLAR